MPKIQVKFVVPFQETEETLVTQADTILLDPKGHLVLLDDSNVVLGAYNDRIWTRCLVVLDDGKPASDLSHQTAAKS